MNEGTGNGTAERFLTECVMPWWPEDEWTRMWRGDDCAMCEDAPRLRNEHGDLITETEWSYVRLCRNQTQAGYSVVIAKRHAPELHHLSVDERSGFWTDVAVLGEVVSSLFRPVKLANLTMGFRMPHFHCHVYPQYERDDPFGLLNPQEGDVRLDGSAWDDRLRLVQEGFAALQPT